MGKKDYKNIFNFFMQEIKKTENSSFIDLENWTLSEELLNGVEIGYIIKDQSDRELLHKIGLEYGLIPLCLNEVVDLELSNESKPISSVVKTIFGKLQIKP